MGTEGAQALRRTAAAGDAGWRGRAGHHKCGAGRPHPVHTVYRVASGNDQLLIWGDTIHAAALQFAHPDWSSTFDHDREQAAATR